MGRETKTKPAAQTINPDNFKNVNTVLTFSP
jgi:hypothetical protein